MNQRPSWHQYFMQMALLVAQRSTCLRRKVGAVIVIENQIISTGYNGAPKHLGHCSMTGCMRKELNVPSGERHELCRGVHAEQNAIIQAAVNGVSIKNSSMYCTNQPCSICSKMIINAEIKTLYIGEPYKDKLAEEILAEADVEINLVDMDTSVLHKI